MSAREELLVELTMERCSDDEAAELMDAYRAEVLHEARREILALSLRASDLKARESWKAGYKGGLAIAAEICTP